MRQDIVNILDYALPVAVFGTGSPNFVLLSGAGGPEMCYPFANRLSQLGTVFVPEHPGFGLAPNPSWLKVPADLANFYALLLSKLNLGDVYLIGHSLGGWVATEMAIRSSARMAGLTLISSAGVKVRGTPIGDNFLWSPEVLPSKLFHHPQPPVSKTAPTDDDLIRHLKRQATVAQLVWKPRWHDPALQRWLPSINVPTAIIWGRQDQLFPVGNANLLAEKIPHSTLHILDDCGHVPIIEQPDAAMAIIQAQLDGDVR